MPHELASALQQTSGVGDLGPTEEPDVDVSGESIHISKRRLTDTRGRMAVMQ